MMPKVGDIAKLKFGRRKMEVSSDESPTLLGAKSKTAYRP